jgi:3-hydroxybutyryl-CoA dehydrogenase
LALEIADRSPIALASIKHAFLARHGCVAGLSLVAHDLLLRQYLDTECLGVHTGEDSGREGSNAVGFARYRNGDDAPSNLIELVCQPNTEASALAAARAVFEAHGFDLVVCKDLPGRIVDRLARPKYNDALRFLDEGLASVEDMDRTRCMGLGYPDGPIERVTRGGLAQHFDVSKSIY